MIKFTCTRNIFKIVHGRKYLLILKTFRTHYFIEKRKLWKYFGCLLSKIIDAAGLKNRTNQFINDIRNFNNEHIIECYIVTESNIPEEPH